MSGVYTKRLAAVYALAALQNIFVPAGRVWVVRCVDITENAGSATSQFAFRGHLDQVIWAQVSGSTGLYGSRQWTGRQVFNAGEHFGLWPVVGKWDVTVSGYDFAA
jgi:hypothetical protein